MTRKEELEKELGAIHEKEMVKKLEEMKDIEGSVEAQLRIKKEKMHKMVTEVDLALKFLIAVFVSAAFLFTIYHGVMHGNSGTKASVHFQMISVLGPLFGAVLQYYFGKNKAGANGE